WSCPTHTCTFDARGSTDDKGIVSYSWDLNKYPGGTATGPVVSATYAHPDTRYVTLTVRDAGGLSNSVTQKIVIGSTPAPTDQPPTAKFTANCSGLALHQCAFDASGSTDDVGIVSYRWDWGNGRSETKTGASARNTWAAAGPYMVTLTVTDTKGQQKSVSQSVAIP
ncbi:MAG TPA: PKD domain-containing protein, partial [Gemmatimonadaceae bacterium]